MRYRKLSATGDYVFGNGQNSFLIDSPEAVAQAVMTRLKLFMGEWYQNTDEGVPYFQGVLGKHSKDEADAVLKSQIAEVEGVIGYSNFSSVKNSDTRGYSCGFTLDTVYGVTQVENLNYGDF